MKKYSFENIVVLIHDRLMEIFGGPFIDPGTYHDISTPLAKTVVELLKKETSKARAFERQKIISEINEWVFDHHDHHGSNQCNDCDYPYVNSLKLISKLESLENKPKTK